MLKVAIIVSVIAIVVLVRSIYKDLFGADEKPQSLKERKSVTLQELSKIWRLQNLEEEEARLRKQVEELKKQLEVGNKSVEKEAENEGRDGEKENQSETNQAKKEILFNNASIQAFYEKYIQPLNTLKEAEKSVILSLLDLLDKEGNTPSVVRTGGQKETDTMRPANEFDILKNITLAEHSIHVAEIMIEMNDSLITLAKRVIAALAHDIGKIPKFYNNNKKYTFGSHPQVSVMVLRTVKGFNDLEYAKEVEEAVLKHHLTPREGLGLELKQADKEARSRELLEAGVKEVKSAMSSEGGEENGIPDIGKYPAKQENAKRDIDIEWLPIDELVSRIREVINRETANGGFDAFSDTRGYVFVNTGFVMDTFKELAKKYDKYDEYDFTDASVRQRILIAIADALRDNGYLADMFVKRGYFANKFDLIGWDGQSLMKGKIFMPFLGSAFTNDLGELESRKIAGGFLKKIREVKISVG